MASKSKALVVGRRTPSGAISTNPKFKGGGRPPHEPTDRTRAQVEHLARIGTRQEDIAIVLDISIPTLIKHYREILDKSMIIANAAIGNICYAQAMGSPAEYDELGRLIRAERPPVPAMGMFWMKTRAGWKEVTTHEAVGKDGEKLPVGTVAIFKLPDNGRGDG